MAGSFPDGGVHKNGRVDSNHIFVEQNHAVPPVFFDVVFQFNSVLSIVVNRAKAVVNFARLKYITVFLAVCYQFLENIFLCHCINLKIRGAKIDEKI